jgi:hypothetical protein
VAYSGVLRDITHGKCLLLAGRHGESSSQQMNEKDRLAGSVNIEITAPKRANHLMSELSNMQNLPGKHTLLCDSFLEQFLEICRGTSQYFRGSVFHPATVPSKKAEMFSGGSLLALSVNPSGIGGTSTGS